MDSELASLEKSSPKQSGFVPNPVFQQEQRAGTATDAGESTEVAARVAGDMVAEADQERLKIEQEVAAIEEVAPGSDRAKDAEAAKAQAERDAT